jgi:hypothetical protein
MAVLLPHADQLAAADGQRLAERGHVLRSDQDQIEDVVDIFRRDEGELTADRL